MINCILNLIAADHVQFTLGFIQIHHGLSKHIIIIIFFFIVLCSDWFCAALRNRE